MENSKFKILGLKSGNCMFNIQKSKTDHETQPNCETCQAKEILEYYLLPCSKYEKEREVLFKTIKKITKKQSLHPKLNNER